MSKGNSKAGRLFPDFERQLREAMNDRRKNNLIKNPQIPKNIGIAEAQRLLTRTQGFRLSLNEIRTKPKKENVKDLI